ncbi:MAG TPA: protease modulator HflK N-terminal domain-containing protein, partial [Rubrivivax sp.]|nr:protease modulator HflK N-terminal domain-containing protein [Rubrivivax sp.]
MSWSTAPRGVAAADVLRAFGAWLRALVRSPAQRLRRNGTLVLSSGRNEGPPDLDELWRDFNRKLSGMFGKRGQSPGGPPDRPDGGGPFQPNMKGAGIGAGLIAGVVALVWLGSGVFIVQEGQQAVVTSFG